MKKIGHRVLGYLPYLVMVVVLVNSETWSSFAMRNLYVQLALFAFVACLPALITKKMSFVDVAWPWGLVMIGLQTAIYGEGYAPRVMLIATLYILAGLRMGSMGLLLFKPGLLKVDLPRYQYQRRRWEKAGYRNEMLSMQYEILIQALANCSLLALPAFLIGFNTTTELSWWEILGALLWLGSLALEHHADLQKNSFLKKMRQNKERNRFCNVGLWKYSRHPNYFFEWMVWNSLILMSLPSLIYFFAIESSVIYFFLVIGLFAVSRIMYVTLVYYTGAVPAEYYSAQKRVGYAEYQKSTQMFFPGPVKK